MQSNSLRTTLDDGETIRTTANHLFYVPGQGFIPAHEIKPQMRFQLAKDDRAEVKNRVQNEHRLCLNLNPMCQYTVRQLTTVETQFL